MIAALAIVGGFFFALAALAWVGDRLTDRHVDTSPRMPQVPGQLISGVNDWRTLTPDYIGGRHHTRTAMALARTSPENSEDCAADTASPLIEMERTHPNATDSI